MWFIPGYMPNLHSAALAFPSKVAQLLRPVDVLDHLHKNVAARCDLKVLGAWRLAFDPQDWQGYVLGKNVFAHPSVAEDFWLEYFAQAHMHGPSATARMAWQNVGSFTLTEAMRASKASNGDHWIFDLATKYGMRDGFYVPLGAWMVVYWSSHVVKLDQPTRASLEFATIHAVRRLVQLMPRRRRADKPPSLTARELRVLSALSRGQAVAEIATELNITQPTVRTFARRAKSKLGAKTLTQAVASALRYVLMR